MLGFSGFSGGLSRGRWAVGVHRVDAGALLWRIFVFSREALPGGQHGVAGIKNGPDGARV